MKTGTKWLLLAVIALHLVLGLLYDWATPILEASDEGSHFAVVHWLAQGNPLPIQQPAHPNQAWAQEGSQPPLYYVLAARLAALVNTGDFDQVFVRNPLAQAGIAQTTHNVNLFRHPLEGAPLAGTRLAVELVRWFSLLLSCATVYLSAQLCRALFPGRDALALLTAALVAFNPMALFINASVNNDNLLMLLSTCGLLLTLRLMRPGRGGYVWPALGLGVVLGLAALTKISGLVLWPVAAAGVAWGAWRDRDVRRFAVSGVLIAVPAIAICGWWFVRNYQLYGEWLGLGTMIAVAGPRPQALTLWQLIGSEWYGFWLSYWGVFGGFTLVPAAWVYRFFDVLTLAASAGCLWSLLRRRRRVPWPELLLLAAFIALTLVSLVRWTLQTYASQGRLMFGAIAPLALLMAGGLLGPLGRWRERGAAAVTATLVIVATIVPLAYIAPRYAPPARA